MLDLSSLKEFTEFKSILLSLIVIVAALFIQNIITRLLHKYIEDKEYYHKMRRSVNVTTLIITIVFVLAIWLNAAGSLTTYLGILSAGIAVALKDFFLNLAAWFYIVLKRPFLVKDRIEISGVKGDVIDIGIFQFTLLELGNWVDSDQSTGRIIHVPNAKIFTDNLCNYSSGFSYIWNEINVLLTFESDWRSAKIEFKKIADSKLLHLTEQIKKEIVASTRKYYIDYKHLTPIVYTDVKNDGVQLSIRYLVKPQKRRSVNDAMWQDIMTYIENKADVDLAYPTMRVVK